MRDVATPQLDDPPRRTPPTGTEEAVRAVLCQDYERLERQLQSIVVESTRNDPIALRVAWQTFEGELVHHCDDEEVHVIPAFAAQKPTEAHALVAQHEQIRTGLATLGADLDSHCLPPERIADFVATFREHLRYEEDLLYPWAAHWLEEAARERIRNELSNTRKSGPSTTEEWQIDLEHSNLRFSLRHIVIHEIWGRFRRWGGTIVLSATDLAKSSVHVWVDLASIDTGDLERDAQIRSPEFFDVAHFPRATFSSSEVQLPEHAHPVVKGFLALHGFMEAVDLEITRHDRWTDAEKVEHTSYEVRSRVDRRRFGLRWNLDLDVGGVVVGDDIEVVANVQAIRVRQEERAESAHHLKPG
jgi:polyisoprenoid-binding protein YceI